ncbi:MAG: penicillin acylase family protein, partial [Ilumatobacteraceae bacterium]
MVAALLAACSGDDDAGGSTSPTASEAAPTTAASTSVATSDEVVEGSSVTDTVDTVDTIDTVADTSSPPSSEPEATYTATIRRDGAGVPHIEADDWGSLGFGQGWALAEDRACTLIDQVIKVRGERARWFGAGEDDEHIESDLAYRHLGLRDEVPTRWSDQPAQVVDVIDGYVAGFNAQLDDVGADGVSGWCAGEPWVQPITTDDLYAVVGDILLLASGNNFISAIATAQPPSDPAPTSEPPETSVDPAATSVPVTTGASNGWAFGADRSASGGGLLLANPHYPWEGELRFWEAHLTIPGELDAYGVALSGLPGLQIAFNEDIAWTHTVSAGHRFTLYRYDLAPGDPTSYLVDGQARPMTPTEITIEVAGASGAAPTEVTRTLWSTHHGPIINLGPLGWSAEQAVAIRDANADITTVLAQYLAMDTATSMDELQAAHEEHQGVPWVNTIATSADGRAWYADTSATPNLSAEALAAWAAEIEAGGLLALAYNDFGVVLLDGSNSVYEWVDDPAAPAPGLVPYADLPQLERTDYVFNANDSYWLAHPDELLTGYSPLHGEEGTAQSPRTRMNAVLLGESAEPWSIDDVQAAIFSN